MKPPYTKTLMELEPLPAGSDLDDFSKRVLSVICKNFYDDSEAPTEGEIERTLGASSRGKVARAIERLEKLRYIYKEPNTYRGIQLLEKGETYQMSLFPQANTSIQVQVVDEIDEMRKLQDALLQQAADLDLNIKKAEEERARAREELLAREKRRHEAKICSRCGEEFFLEDSPSQSWCNDCYLDNAKNSSDGMAAVKAIIAIVNREGGGRLAVKFVIELIRGLAALPESRPKIRELNRFHGDYNKRNLDNQ